MNNPTWDYTTVGQLVIGSEGRIAFGHSKRGGTVEVYLETVFGARATLYVPTSRLPELRALLNRVEILANAHIK